MFGKILLNGETVLEDVEIHIGATRPTSEPFTEWWGNFSLPANTEQMLLANKITEGHTNVRTLVLEDGMTGQFIPSDPETDGFRITVYFKGTGVLA